MMNAENHQELDNYVRSRLGLTLDRLLAPLQGDSPAGPWLRDNGLYHEIREARRADDPSLPQGQWSHDLKRADWAKVSRLAKAALQEQSKDLQLGVWLLEAEIHLQGFQAVAPCLLAMKLMCESFWEDLHPRIRNGDLEYRTNLIVWANEKLLPALRLTPITKAGGNRAALTWNDREMAQRYESIKSRVDKDGPRGDYPGLHAFNTAVAETPTRFYARLHAQLEDGLQSIALFSAALDKLCGKEAPTLAAMHALLEQIHALAAGELEKRGAPPGERDPDGPAAGGEAGSPDAAGQAASPPDGAGPPPPDGSGPENHGDAIRTRAEAYARLAAAADFLLRDEPHSPAPYLVRRAIEWGAMNTTELYTELFLRFKGNLNIFELLGIQTEGEETS